MITQTLELLLIGLLLLNLFASVLILRRKPANLDPQMKSDIRELLDRKVHYKL